MRITDPRNGKEAPLDSDLSLLWSKEYAEWSRQTCKHERQELRRGVNKGGQPVVRMQCVDCGEKIGNAVARPPNAHELPEHDESLHSAYCDARNATLDKIRQRFVEIQLRRWRGKETGESYFTQAHNAYLSSRAWKDRRRLVMERAQSLCEGCRKAGATEVHHLSYAHWGNEFLFELVALCSDCHDRIHAKGDHEALVAGCKSYIHASKGSYCLLFDMPMAIALEAEGPCTFERNGYEAIH